MKPLPNGFRADGFDFTLLARRGRIALLAKTKPDHSRHYFEVVIIQQRPERILFGRTIPANESMPTAEQWGTYGWSPFDFESALKKFQELSEIPKWSHGETFRQPRMAEFRFTGGLKTGSDAKTMSG